MKAILDDYNKSHKIVAIITVDITVHPEASSDQSDMRQRYSLLLENIIVNDKVHLQAISRTVLALSSYFYIPLDYGYFVIVLDIHRGFEIFFQITDIVQ